MCFCDGCYYLITNKVTGEKHLMREYVKFNYVVYAISWNTHPECQQVYRDLVKIHGIEDDELCGRYPDKYRHLLPPERQ